MMSDSGSSGVFLATSREVASHFTSHTQKHAGSVVYLYQCMPSLDFILGMARFQANIPFRIKRVMVVVGA